MTNIRHTIDYIRSKFEERGYKLLSMQYVNNKQKLEFICPNGHHGEMTWSSFRDGHECIECSGQIVTIDDVRDKFKQKGFELLSETYINNHQELTFKCSEGHISHISYNHLKYGRGCPECRFNKKVSNERIVKEFSKYGYTVLKPSHENGVLKISFMCPRGHQGKIKWVHFMDGHRCRTCYEEDNTKEGNPIWNPNLTDEYREEERCLSGYSKWRRIVYMRDKFCQICGTSKGRLEAHHILGYWDRPDLRMTYNNGVLLCVHCHKLFHRIYGKRGHTKEQFDEFVSKQRLSSEIESSKFTYQVNN